MSLTRLVQRRFRTITSRWKQNRYADDALNQAHSAVLFLVPPKPFISGGILSIFNLCAFSRRLLPSDTVLMATYPGKWTCARYPGFKNTEKIWRFDQIVAQGNALKKLIIHIPEYYASCFYKHLSAHEKAFLKKIPNLHLNILNQNIESMPAPQALTDLKKLTPVVTQTMAHHRYATQEMADKWQMPTHLFSTYLDFSAYPGVPGNQKEKTIVLSPDENPHRSQIKDVLHQYLPDYQVIEMSKMSFDAYVDMISKAFAVITLGEGFDGYFIQPSCVGGIGIAVYNDVFFPDASWKELANVYDSYEDLCARLPQDIRKWERPAFYNKLSRCNKEKQDALYGVDLYINHLKRFYAGMYDFLPKEK